MKFWTLLFALLFTASLVRAEVLIGNKSFGPGPGYGVSSIFISEFKAFPNPTSTGSVTIEFNYQDEENLTIRVYNLIGKEILFERIGTSSGLYSKTIDLSDYPKGIYIIEVSNGTQKQTKRLSYI